MDAGRARELFSYDEKTGVLIWRATDRFRSAGDQVGHIGSNGHLVVSKLGEFGYLQVHRIIWLVFYGENPKGVIDHINGIKTDNRISNLRDVSVQINVQNQREPHKNNKSGLLGVSWDKKFSKWRAQITITKDGRTRSLNLGRYSTKEQAHSAYLNKKRQIHEGNTL